LQGYGPPLPWKVGKCPRVATVQPIRGAAACRAVSRGTSRAGHDDYVVGFGSDLLDNQAGRNERQKALGQKAA
jgi:hypothetical protein